MEASSTQAQTAPLDADQIQNVINMSMAQAFDVVSTWMLPQNRNNNLASASSSSSDARRLADDREFEMLAMRPPRLGVGAVPRTTASNKDTNKLRHKLTGQKRSRDEANGSPGALSGKGKGKSTAAAAANDESSEEEESRASVFSKSKANGVVPTQLPKKKKKKTKTKELNEPNPEEEHHGGEIGGEDEQDDGEWSGIFTPRMDPPATPALLSSALGSSTMAPPSRELSFTATGSLLGRLNPVGPVSAMNETPKSTPNPTISPPSSIASSQRMNGIQSPSSLSSFATNGHQGSINSAEESSKPKKRKRKKKRSLNNTDLEGEINTEKPNP